MLGLSRTDRARLSSMSVRCLSPPECSNSPWCQALKSSKPSTMWTHGPGTVLQGQGCRVPECLFHPHSVPLSPTNGLVWQKDLGPDWLQLCHLTLLCVVFSSSLGVGGLFCSLRTIFRVSWFCCSCFFGVKWEEVSALPSSSVVFFYPLSNDINFKLNFWGGFSTYSCFQ